ncbi:hypothetical protein TRICI_000604 [Trichomonascus ciferrii]|uniref:Integral membrane protein n=1 Tax=Trichomonascus ciferrii TaxID=44093 RepID=A0A642VD07_9ASCO|nr:hypothetical protein TRICI_000604 [Trichomonascus ciferrii]
MASRDIFDPIKLLRVAPVLTTTATVVYGLNERLYLGVFVRKEQQAKANAILPGYFDVLFRKGVKYVVTGYTSTIGFALANLVGGSYAMAKSSPSTQLYWTGLGLAALHFAFVPLVAGSIKDIVEDQPEGKTTSRLQDWLDIHRFRLIFADIPSWLCFIAGFIAL